MKKGSGAIAQNTNYSYQSSIYDFSKQRPATHASKRPSSVMSSTSSKKNGGANLGSATSIELRSDGLTGLLKTESQGKNSMPNIKST